MNEFWGLIQTEVSFSLTSYTVRDCIQGSFLSHNDILNIHGALHHGTQVVVLGCLIQRAILRKWLPSILSIHSICGTTILSIVHVALSVSISTVCASIGSDTHVMPLSLLFFLIEYISNDFFLNFVLLLHLKYIIWKSFLLKISSLISNIFSVTPRVLILILEVRHFHSTLLIVLLFLRIWCLSIQIGGSLVFGFDLRSYLFERLIQVIVNFQIFRRSNFKR